MFESFEVKTDLNQGDALSLMLLNLTLEKTVSEMQKDLTSGITITRRIKFEPK